MSLWIAWSDSLYPLNFVTMLNSFLPSFVLPPHGLFSVTFVLPFHMDVFLSTFVLPFHRSFSVTIVLPLNGTFSVTFVLPFYIDLPLPTSFFPFCRSFSVISSSLTFLVNSDLSSDGHFVSLCCSLPTWVCYIHPALSFIWKLSKIKVHYIKLNPFFDSYVL